MNNPKPATQNRRSRRLKGYDYSSPGVYFVTIVTHARECLFGDVINGGMQLNEFGEIVRSEWQRTEQIRQNVKLDNLIIMPNHLHGIIFIYEPLVGADGCPPYNTDGTPLSASGTHSCAPLRRKPKSLGSIIAGFKSAGTAKINQQRGTPGAPVWQRNYYDRIIRDDGELDRARQYILDNPIKWELDRENPNNIPGERSEKHG